MVVMRTYILEFGLAIQFLAEMLPWVPFISISFPFLIHELPYIKVVIKVLRKAQNKAITPEAQQKYEQKYTKASINECLSPFLGRP